MDIEFKKDAVCYAGGEYLYAPKGTSSVELLDVNLYKINMGDVIDKIDFKLNTIEQGDCIASSEIDTEQKYNDAVEVFGLFGHVFNDSAIDEYRNFNSAESLTCCDNGLWQTNTDRWNKRKLTYVQLMVIGELKRLELKVEKGKQENKIVSINDVSAEWALLFEKERVKVGDTISLRYKSNPEQIIHTGKLLYRSKDHIILLKGDHDVHLHRCEWIIEKPKTPEEILHDELVVMRNRSEGYFIDELLKNFKLIRKEDS